MIQRNIAGSRKTDLFVKPANQRTGRMLPRKTIFCRSCGCNTYIEIWGNTVLVSDREDMGDHKFHKGLFF
jgi:hypothetical protein